MFWQWTTLSGTEHDATAGYRGVDSPPTLVGSRAPIPGRYFFCFSLSLISLPLISSKIELGSLESAVSSQSAAEYRPPMNWKNFLGRVIPAGDDFRSVTNLVRFTNGLDPRLQKWSGLDPRSVSKSTPLAGYRIECQSYWVPNDFWYFQPPEQHINGCICLAKILPIVTSGLGL